MLNDKEDEELQYKDFVFRANEIPRSTKEPLYQRIMENKEERRIEVRRLSMAITK